MDKLVDFDNEDHDYLFKLVVIGSFYNYFVLNLFAKAKPVLEKLKY